jgi:flagellar hook-associated protein 2
MSISFNAANLLNGNGIDVNSVVSEIQAAQSGQATVWQGDVTDLQTQATALTSINNDLNNLAAAAKGFTGQNGALTVVSATSAQPLIVSATAHTGATTANYSVVVKGLASIGTLYTDSVASANTSILVSPATTGDLALQIGGSGGTTADIAITAGSNDTLTTLAASINSLSATNQWGITASVVTDASGARLAIYSQASGSPGALAVANNTTSMAFEAPVGGTDALISINGVPFASTTNTVTGAIPDVTLNLVTADSATPVEVTVGPNTTAIANSINNFVVEYNTVIGDINTQFAVNPATNTQGPLGSDTFLRNLQSSLLSNMTYATTDPTSVGSGLTSLAALGIVMNRDGTLSVNQTATATAPGFPDVLAANLSGVQNFFSNANSTGFADNLNTALTQMTYPSTGILNSDLAENQGEQTAITTEIANFQTQMAAQKIQLDAEFSQVNANLEEYPFLLQQVTAILGSMSGGSTATTATSTNTTPTSGESANGTSSTSGTSS